jgi:hypothetical protein
VKSNVDDQPLDPFLSIGTAAPRTNTGSGIIGAAVVAIYRRKGWTYS